MVALTLYVCSFISGAAALAYQVAWAKMLALTFGSTTLAVSAVVAGFMGGMGLGAWLYHRLNDRFDSPLRAYACLELGIAVAAFSLTLLMQPLPHVFAGAASVVPSGLWMNLFRIASTLLLLLVPSALMGATYPALCTALIRSRSELDRRLGIIYGLNTLGAAAGALLAGLLTVEHLGLRGTVLLGNAINLTAAAMAANLVRFGSTERRAHTSTAVDEALPSQLPLWLTASVLFASGFATLGYEIVWFRALRYIVGNSTYALTDVLVVFLLGLGFGSLLHKVAVRRLGPELALGLCHLAVAGLAILAIGAVLYVLEDPALRDQLSIFSVTLRIRPWWWRIGAATATALAIMLPATILMGLAFPLASRLFLGSISAVSRRTGSAYLIANLGAVLGSVGAALLILPQLGTVGGTKALATVSGLLGLLVLAGMGGGRRRFLVPAAAVAVLLALVGARALPERIDFRGETLASLLVPKLLFEEEGDLATVQVRADPRNPDKRAMVIDGSVIACSRSLLADQYRKQMMLAHLPMVLDREIQRTLNVGLASSSTLAASARYPWVTSLDAVEINAAVLKGARYFDESAVLDDPRTSVHIEDAVHFLLRNPGRYDLIISDGKQNAEFSGNARMLSREFYEYSLSGLTACGIFIQWIPITTQPDDFEIILRTFLSVFPETEIFYEPVNSIYMVASRCSLNDREKLGAEEAAELGVFGDLGESGSEDPRDLLSSWIASADQVRRVLSDGPMNLADRMLLEFSSYRNRPTSDEEASENIALLLEARSSGPSEAGMALAPPASPVVRWSRTLQLAERRALEGHASEAVRLALEVLREDPDHPAARAALARFRVR